MNPKRILFVCVNDGSDMRINKELSTLAGRGGTAIDFIGVDEARSGKNFAKDKTASCRLVEGRRRSAWTVLRLGCVLFGKLVFRRYDSVHIINEQLLLLFWPLFFWQKRVVLDVFDSMFLKTGGMGPVMGFARWLAYTLADAVIVTDDTRAGLIPDRYKRKVVVLENFPPRFNDSLPPKRHPDGVTLFFSGSMNEQRGIKLINRLLDTAPDVHVVAAGWVYGPEAEALVKRDRVEFLGTLTQKESMQVAASCDYILCLYDPRITNNIYASPNKIYDAVQSGTPVVINAEVLCSSFVSEHNLGVIVPAYDSADIEAVAGSLRRGKREIRIDAAMRDRFVWEHIEKRLLDAHHVQA